MKIKPSQMDYRRKLDKVSYNEKIKAKRAANKFDDMEEEIKELFFEDEYELTEDSNLSEAFARF